jgi:hypothetical protein
MEENIPLPFGVLAAALKYAPCEVSRLQAVNDCFQACALHSGQIGNVAFPPFSATQPSRREWLFLPLLRHSPQRWDRSA